MWRLSLRILLFSLVPYAVDAIGKDWEDVKIGACPENKVCVVFVNFKDKPGHCYDSEGKKQIGKWGGYLWEGENTCDPNNYHNMLQGFLVIEPQTPRSWSFEFTAYTHHDNVRGGRDEQKLTDLELQFPEAKLGFQTESSYAFAVKKDGDWNTPAFGDMKETGSFMSHDCNWILGYPSQPCIFKKYSFIINSPKDDDRDLIHYFGVEEFNLTRKNVLASIGGELLNFRDIRFVEKLSKTTMCHAERIVSPCYEDCQEIDVSNATHSIDCNSTLWFHGKEYANLAREWRKADEVVCEMGEWRAIWKEDNPGHQILNADWEVQCAHKRPSKNTAKYSAMMIGIGIGGGTIVIIALVLVGFVLFKKFKRNDTKDTNRGTTRSESNAEGKSSKTQSNRIPGFSPSASTTPSKTPTPSANKPI